MNQFRIFHRSLTVWILLGIGCLLARPVNAQTPGDWSAAGTMSTVRGTPTAIVLQDGTVLVVGGASSPVADLYNPVANSWTTVPSMSTARNSQAGTLLSDGRVLVAGGQDASGNTLASAEIYNPTTQTWTVTGSMTSPRYLHSASLLPNGQVLVAGGWASTCCSSNGQPGAQYPLTSSELWNPSTGIWTATGSMANPHAAHTATVLNTGNVLVAGGQDYGQGSILEVGITSAAELYEYATGAWTSAGNMTNARDDAAAVLLSNGTVLVAGGNSGGCCSGLSSAEIFDPTAMTWTAIQPMTTGRNGPAGSAILNATNVLISGGYSCCSDPTPTRSSTEYYNPATGTWTLTGSLTQARAYFTSVTLQDGTVLAVGGNFSSAERYYPDATNQTVTIQIANTGVSPVSYSITGAGCAPGTYTSYGNLALNWTPGSSCQVTATAPNGWSFASWSDGSTANPRTFIAPSAATTYTANFSQSTTSYQLTTAANPARGGSVSPATGNSYASGTVVNLSATAKSGYVFTNWTGNVANPTSASTTVTMNAAQSVTANFSTVSTVRITVGTSPAGLSFTVDGTTYTSKQTLSWTAASSHTIATTSLQTSSGTQNSFASWSDGGAILHLVAPSTATTYTASFNTSYQLTTAASPTTGGTVLPATGAFYASGTVVNLSATPSSGYTFSGWTGNVASASSSSTTVAMSAPQTVVANFTSASAPPSGLTFTPPSVSFGTVSLSGGSSQILTVTNNGTTAVKFTKIALGSLQGATSQDLTYDGGCTSSLAAGKSCKITLSLWPSQTGPVSAILSLQDNAAGSPQQVSVNATVTAP
jgi:uncharacterized repeat protein (TIGR02543 family)